MRPVVFITGASSGIGRALAREYAGLGYDIAAFARRADRLEELAAECRKVGAETLVLPGDVTHREDLRAAVRRTVERFGRLDVAVANAGFGVSGRFADLATEDFRRQFEVNFYAVVETAYACLPELQKTRGCLAMLGSISACVSLPGVIPYSTSKAAVKSLAEGLRAELHSSGVGVTLINPGFIRTEIRRVDNWGHFRPETTDPVPEWLQMKAERAARAIRRAIDRRRPELVLTFHGKIIAWLQRFMPSLMRLVARVIS